MGVRKHRFVRLRQIALDLAPFFEPQLETLNPPKVLTSLRR
jgi:hypothetical protein